MQTKTQASASARALVGAALIGSAMGMTVIAANAAGSLSAQDQNHDARTQDAGLRGPVSAASDAAPAKPKFVRASILPEPPAILPSTPIPYTAFRAPTPTKLEATDQDVECLTRAVYFESRGDSDIGQAAVAQVVLNRTRHPAFPKSVCGVVNQGRERGSCQFSFVCRPTKVTEPREWRRAREVAERALDGHVVDEVGTATFFHAARINPGWKHARVGRFGNHIFYRYAGARGAASAFRGVTKPSLLDSITKPIQTAFSKPAVATAAAPPAPILGLTPASAKPAAPVLKPVTPTLTPVAPVEAHATQVSAQVRSHAPAQVQATPAAEPAAKAAPHAPTLQPTSSTSPTLTPAVSTAS